MKLLLHACCGPCSLEPIRLLEQEDHDITIFYSNSNIEPETEYTHRLSTLLEWANKEAIPVVEDEYDNAAWHQALASWNNKRPRAERCRLCYRARFERAAHYAATHGFEAIGTTLSVSPYQHTDAIREELEHAVQPYPGLSILWEDYRPYYPEATRRSRNLGMYRQNFCGCALSDAEARAERDMRKAERKKKRAQMRLEKLQALTTDDFDYDLPEAQIAQEPAEIRDQCKLLVMKRDTGTLEDKIFTDIIDYLHPGDVLVVNETRVMPARLLGAKRETGGQAEVFLLREAQTSNLINQSNQEALWEALVKPGKRLKPGAVIDFTNDQNDVVLSAEVVDWVENAQKGERLVRLTTPRASLDEALHEVGNTPLPPYIKNYTGNKELYQTVYSKDEHSAAAPTAGLHFTQELIERIKAKGIEFKTVNLEVGLDTFRVVDEMDPKEHKIHTEFYSVPQETVDAIIAAKARGNKVIAVGTTSVRSLESAWDKSQEKLIAREREATSLYILPGYTFNVVDGLITNFHVPRSTLMMLVSAFSTRDNIMKAYRHAIKRQYRFLSFGDAMFIR